MFDNPKQLAAYKLLKASTGHGSAHSITAVTAGMNSAKAKSTAVAALKKADKTYPDTVTASLTVLAQLVSVLDAAQQQGKTLVDGIGKYQDVNELMNMSVGFDAYIRANELHARTGFPLVTAMADTAVSDAFKAAVDGIDLTALTSTMDDINLAVPSTTGTGTGTGAGTGTTSPGPTQAQIIALSTATSALAAPMATLTTATAGLKNLTDQAIASVNNASQAFHDGVAISMLSVLKEDPRMAGALSALVPQNVLDSL